MTLEKLQKDMIAAMRERTASHPSYQQLRRSESITAAETTFLRI